MAKGVALFHSKTRRWVEGQKAIFDTLSHRQAKALPSFAENDKVIWFHAASLGEFEQGRPVIEAIRHQYPQYRIWLTFFSPSGYEIRKNYEGADVVSYLPADTPANVKRFLEEVRPSIAFFIKYEFWYHYLTQLQKNRVPTFLLSAIFRPNQLFFKTYGGFYRTMLFCFDHIFVQNLSSQQLLAEIGYKAVTLTGDTRLDRVTQIAQRTETLPPIEAFKHQHPLLIVGSAWPDDMEVLIPFLNRWDEPLQVIIAPHEINSDQIATWQRKLDKKSAVYSRVKVEDIQPPFDILHSANATQSPSILFLDTVGMLAHTYQYADFVYIGGAFGDGLHNILEPAVFGAPLFFGHPHYDKFQEAHDLLAAGGASSISSADGLYEAFEQVYHDKIERQRRADICRTYIATHSGATQKVIDFVQKQQYFVENQ